MSTLSNRIRNRDCICMLQFRIYQRFLLLYYAVGKNDMHQNRSTRSHGIIRTFPHSSLVVDHIHTTFCLTMSLSTLDTEGIELS